MNEVSKTGDKHRFSLYYEQRNQFFFVYLIPAVILNSGNIAAYFFQFFIARRLDLQQFAEFNALFAAVNVLCVPAAVAPLIVTDFVILASRKGLHHGETTVLFVVLQYALPAAIILLFVSWSIDPAAVQYFGLASGTILPLAAAVSWNYVQSILGGLLQARRSYLTLAFANFTSTSLRPVFGFLLVGLLSGGVAAAVWSIALPFGVAALFMLYCLRSSIKQAFVRAEPAAEKRRSPIGGTDPSTVAVAGRQLLSTVCFAVLTNVDVVLVHAMFAGDEAGLYSGAAVLSRVALLLPSVISGAIFSESTHERHNKVDTDRSSFAQFTQGVLATVILGGAAAIGLSVASSWILRLTFGEPFSAAAPLLLYLAPAMALMAVAQAIMMYAMGKHDWRLLWPNSALTMAFPALVLTTATSAVDVAVLLLATSGATVALNLAFLITARGRSTS